MKSFCFVRASGKYCSGLSGPFSRKQVQQTNSGLDKFKFSAPEIRSVNSALRACISNGAKSHH